MKHKKLMRKHRPPRGGEDAAQSSSPESAINDEEMEDECD